MIALYMPVQPLLINPCKSSSDNHTMKVLVVVLLLLLATLQYRLWFGDGSVQEVWRLNQQARESKAELLRLRSRNQALEAEVADLKSGLDAIEERARSELGMIDRDETFYQFVRERRAKINNTNAAIESSGGPKLIDRTGAAVTSSDP